MKKKRNAVILWKKHNNYGKNVMVGSSAYMYVVFSQYCTIVLNTISRDRISVWSP